MKLSNEAIKDRSLKKVTVNYRLAELTPENAGHRLNRAFDVLFEQVVKSGYTKEANIKN